MNSTHLNRSCTLREKILISSCLLGNKVRYDGKSKAIPHPQIATWLQQQRLVVFCPEVAGGLAVPRPKAEIKAGQVVTESGDDVSEAFTDGAAQALALCQQHRIRFALLKDYSPSCGSTAIYNGEFSAVKTAGQGITTQMLSANDITVYSEVNLAQLVKIINALDTE